jgi:hypothetical protein
MPIARLLLASLISALSVTTVHGQELPEPYTVEVWANVLFGVEGKPTEYALFEEAKYPEKFAQNVKARVAQAKIQPPVVAERPATLRTGVRLNFLVTPQVNGGAQVKLNGLTMAALPIKRYFASYPKDISKTGGWTGEVEGICKIGVDGRCAAIKVTTLPGMPESVRRYAKASLEGWVFVPQEIDGKPIEGEYILRLVLNTLDEVPENFKQDKFLRILNSR